jgi:hypothetical protein
VCGDPLWIAARTYIGLMDWSEVLRVGGLQYVSNLESTTWIGGRLHPFARDVGSVIPEGFEQYARLLHPAHRAGVPVKWREIAQANRRVVHSQMQFGNIARSWTSSPNPRLWSEPPRPAMLSLELTRALVDVLRPRTRTPQRCWFAVWVGFVHFETITSRAPSAGTPGEVPRLVTPGREYYVASGALDDAIHGVYGDGGGFQSVSMWWPEDRAWFVSTEIDLAYTYVGASADCIDDLVQHQEIEALRAEIGDGITYDSDHINSSPGPPN